MGLSVGDLAGSYGGAWESHDAQAILALHTRDSIFHVHGLGEAAAGMAAVGRLVAAFITLAPDVHFEPTRVYIGADHFVVEYTMSGTTAGRPFSCDGVDVIAVSDGLIARKDTYLDLPTLERQTGRLPALSADVPSVG